MRWLCCLLVLVGCGPRSAPVLPPPVPSAPPPSLPPAPTPADQLADCAAAFENLSEDDPLEDFAVAVSEGCPAACPGGCQGQAGLETAGRWLAATRTQLGATHPAVVRLDAAQAGVSALVQPPAELTGHYKLPTSDFGLPSTAWLNVVISRDELLFLGEATRLSFGPDGAHLTPSALAPPPGTPLSTFGPVPEGGVALGSWLNQRLLGLEPGMGSSGRLAADSSAAPLIFADAELPAKHLLETVAAFNDYGNALPARLAVAGPDGLVREHLLTLQAPNSHAFELTLTATTFKLDNADPLPLTELPATLAALPEHHRRRHMIMLKDLGDDVHVSDVVHALDVIASAGFRAAAVENPNRYTIRRRRK